MSSEHLANLLTEAEQVLAAVALPPVDDLPPAGRTIRWDQRHARTAAKQTPSADAARNATVALQIELGQANLRRDELAKLRRGSVIPLNRLAGDLVDVFANGRLAARGEIVVVDGNFGVRVVEVKQR
jgi:flagellar motor switch protein FliN/FliY